jgi:AraC-like DNA-binding protein
LPVRALDFCPAAPGVETVRRTYSMPRHRHLRAFATVVLAGVYEEAGYAGRTCAKAGDVLVHPMLDSHANPMISAGVKLIRLEWEDNSEIGGLYQLDDVDELARTAENDLREASVQLKSCLRKNRPLLGRANDWPDLLLFDVARNPATEIGVWAQAHGLARETVSRGLSAAYGVTPSVLRAELRARKAWLRVVRGYDFLGRIAADTGFADQAHMTRWIHRVTGAPPAVWRNNGGLARA